MTFEELIAPCTGPLWTFLLRRVGERGRAEDLYQETLFRAWKALPEYRESGRFQAWLFCIAHNALRDDYRRRPVRPQLIVSRELPDLADCRRTDDRLEAADTRQRLYRGLETLTEEQKEVFLLRMHSELDFRGIAELVDAPLSTVINRMRDALKKLERALEEEP